MSHDCATVALQALQAAEPLLFAWESAEMPFSQVRRKYTSINTTGIQGAVGAMKISANLQPFTARHSWPAAAAHNHDGMPILGWMTD